ncbi:MAG: ABC transporter permease, partial [Candidatus Tectomicrobia bacterium]|nr:ABC transporter permease [Candidatus Tectomicrobia bacterium]
MTMVDVALFTSALRLATPLILAALGGLFSERSGVVNIALEGMMLFGAFSAALITYFSGNPWVGVLGAMLTGGTVALLHAVASLRYGANQVVSGTAINILASGTPSFLASAFFGTTGSTPQVKFPLPTWHLPILKDIPLVGEILGHHTPLVYLALLSAGVAHLVLFSTPFGLRLRAVGENPAAADSLGIPVNRMRYYGVILSGLLSGLAGAFLSIGHGTGFTRNMS